MQETKKKSVKQERKIAREVNGRTTPASGALDNFKGDVRSEKFLIEAKTTSKHLYPFSYKTWEKIRNEAIRDGLRTPVLQVDLEDGKYRYAIVDYGSFSEIVGSDYDAIEVCRASYTLHSGMKTTVLIFPDKRILHPSCFRDIEVIVIRWDVFLDYCEKHTEML